ncbi:MAG: M48 family metallopeptidase [Pseudonocardiales bacterium]
MRAVVVRLAGALEIPLPTLYVADDDALNAGAFGAGDRAFLIYTVGLLATLNERELTAVTAHELAHIVNRDTRVSAVSRMADATAARSTPESPKSEVGVISVTHCVQSTLDDHDRHQSPG